MVLEITTRGSPRDRGLDQGEQLAERIKQAKHGVFHSDLFKQMKPWWAPVWLAVAGLSMIGKGKTKKHVEKYLPVQHEKMLGLAEGAHLKKRLVYGLHYVEVMSGDPRTSYEKPLIQPMCTMAFALPPSTTGDDAIFGRNYDFPGILQPYQVLRREEPDDDRFSTLSLTQFPLVGSHVGLNEKGLLIGYNYGRSWKQDPLDYRKEGVPNMLLLQEALETCSSVQQVVDFVTTFPARTNGGHFGVVDRENNATVIEFTATRHALRHPVDGIMVQTNMYQTPELSDANVPDDLMWKFKDMRIPYTKSPKERFSRASELMENGKGALTMDALQEVLSDHAGREGDDFTVCVHGLTGETLACTIINPRSGLIRVTDTNPCHGTFEEFSF
ncbi:hypothetical protein GF325_11415 [Candidatus Bathyarchaeota archaeon]|nr:hypothetical protein [Candidatus Bathyarchaeota archaeon]